MSTKSNSSDPQYQLLFKLALVLTIGLLVVRAVVYVIRGDALDAASNDDLMRLMSVRDWLSGQDWFDTTQYRVLPEDGVSLHWSRLVDAGIAAVLFPLSLVLSMPAAEAATAVIWPTILCILLICVTAFGARQLFGAIAGAVAAMTVVAYPALASGYFGPGRLDHHSVQILVMSVACLALALPDKATKWGMVAGIACGLSLAISLEMIFLIAALGVAHVADFVVGRRGTAGRLAGFCCALIISAVLFFLIQTPSSEWATLHCDEIGPPFLAIAGVGAGAGLAPLLLSHRFRRPWFIIGVVAVVTVLGLLLSWPFIHGCLQSPYGNLPAETQHFISSTIFEALPVFAFAQVLPEDAFNYFGIAVAAAVITSGLCMLQWRSAAANPGLIYLLIFVWVGLAASTWQMRQVVVVAAVTPLIVGYLVQQFVTLNAQRQTRGSKFALYGVLAATFFQPALLVGASQLQTTMPTQPQSDVIWVAKDAACSAPHVLAHLNTVDRNTILTSMNLGPALIAATHHSALSAPYHRSNDAIMNGTLLEIEDQGQLITALRAIPTTRLLVCANSVYGSQHSLGSRLAAGENLENFTRIAVGNADLMLFEIGGGA